MKEENPAVSRSFLVSLKDQFTHTDHPDIWNR